jgi:hypothetical protein
MNQLRGECLEKETEKISSYVIWNGKNESDLIDLCSELINPEIARSKLKFISGQAIMNLEKDYVINMGEVIIKHNEENYSFLNQKEFGENYLVKN